MASAWLRRNVRQVCDGGPRCRIIYLETVDSAISNPSLSSSERWSQNFEQGAKWNLGLTAGMFCLRIRSDDEEANPPEPHTSLQGEGGVGCLEERSNDCAACSAVRASQSNHLVEGAAP